MRENVFQISKAVLAAIIFSLAFVLIFTLIIQLFDVPIQAVKPVNQVFKILAIATGGIIFIRGDNGLLKGLIYGVIAVIFTYFLFSLVAGALTFSILFLTEIALGGVAGAISGVIAVNIKKT